jgi:hypothetical protein
LEILQSTPCPDKRLLRQIACVFVVVHEAVAHLINAASMALDDDVERVAIAAQTGGD